MRNIEWKILAIGIFIAALFDAILGIIGLWKLIKPTNILAQILCIGGGLIITGFTMGSKAIFTPLSNTYIKIVWFIATALDALTTVIATTYYVILDNPSLEPSVSFEPDHIIKTILGFGLASLLTSSTVMTTYILEKIE